MTSRILSKPLLRSVAKNLDPLAGNGVIQGVITVAGVPARRRVRLYDKPSGMLVDAVMSGADGHYRFSNLRVGHEFFVVANDYQRDYNAVVQDMIVAEVT